MVIPFLLVSNISISLHKSLQFFLKFYLHFTKPCLSILHKEDKVVPVNKVTENRGTEVSFSR